MRRRTLTTVGSATVLSAATVILVAIIRIIFLTLVGMAGLERTVTVAEAGVATTSEDVIQNSKVVLNDYMSETSSHESTILMDAVETFKQNAFDGLETGIRNVFFNTSGDV
jgi:hypothetical protein